MSININKNKQNGVMLIEALMGLLIFSLGIMALIGMQANAITNTMDAKARGDASFLASQVQAKIWTAKSIPSTYAVGTISNLSSSDPLAEWGRNIVNSLPGVGSVDNAGNVTFNSGLEPSITSSTTINNDTEIKIVIRWKHPSATVIRQYETSIWFDAV